MHIIMIGSHGRTGLKRFLMGGVAGEGDRPRTTPGAHRHVMN
jgi:hypothetical protein